MRSLLRLLPAVLTSLLLGAVFVAPALAAKPFMETTDLDDPALEAGLSAMLSDACGTDMSVDASGSVRVKVFADRNGDFRREIDKWFIRMAITNVETAESVLIRDVGPDIVWINRDGDVMAAIVGRSLTGSGVIGRVLINLTTGEVERESGRNVGDWVANTCEALT